ncbi:hypothetical protein P7C70_g4885, partial [Phenoliferia sp. Uapishka_3]
MMTPKPHPFPLGESAHEKRQRAKGSQASHEPDLYGASELYCAIKTPPSPNKVQTTELVRLRPPNILAMSDPQPKTSSKALGKRRANPVFDPLANPRSQSSRSSLVASRYSSGFAYNTQLSSHTSCVNSLAFSPGDGQWLATAGDDKKVFLWNTFGDLSTQVPRATFKGARPDLGLRLFDYSGGNDEMVLAFDLEINAAAPVAGSSKAAQTPSDLWRHDAAVKAISTHPDNPHLFMSASDDGSIRSFDLRTDLGVVATLSEMAEFNDVIYNPVTENIFVTSDSMGRVLLQDARMAFGDEGKLASETAVRQYATTIRLRDPDTPQSLLPKRYDFDASSVTFDPTGRLLCATIARFLPTLFDVSDENPIATFGSGPNAYSNVCTIKVRAVGPGSLRLNGSSAVLHRLQHGAFGGTSDNLFYTAGSDDHNAYVWAVPHIDVLKARRQDLSQSTEISSGDPFVGLSNFLDIIFIDHSFTPTEHLRVNSLQPHAQVPSVGFRRFRHATDRSPFTFSPVSFNAFFSLVRTSVRNNLSHLTPHPRRIR